MLAGLAESTGMVLAPTFGSPESPTGSPRAGDVQPVSLVVAAGEETEEPLLPPAGLSFMDELRWIKAQKMRREAPRDAVLVTSSPHSPAGGKGEGGNGKAAPPPPPPTASADSVAPPAGSRPDMLFAIQGGNSGLKPTEMDSAPSRADVAQHITEVQNLIGSVSQGNEADLGQDVESKLGSTRPAAAAVAAAAPPPPADFSTPPPPSVVAAVPEGGVMGGPPPPSAPTGPPPPELSAPGSVVPPSSETPAGTPPVVKAPAPPPPGLSEMAQMKWQRDQKRKANSGPASAAAPAEPAPEPAPEPASEPATAPPTEDAASAPLPVAAAGGEEQMPPGLGKM